MNQLHTIRHVRSYANKVVHEMIGICKIKLRRPGTQTMAMLTSFTSADRLLRDWAVDAQGVFGCDFEIHYVDGSALCGCIVRRRRNRGCLSLGNFVRQTIMEIGQTPQEALSVLRFERRLGRQGIRSEAVDTAFLSMYEIEDFGDVDSSPVRGYDAATLSD